MDIIFYVCAIIVKTHISIYLKIPKIAKIFFIITSILVDLYIVSYAIK